MSIIRFSPFVRSPIIIEPVTFLRTIIWDFKLFGINAIWRASHNICVGARWFAVGDSCNFGLVFPRYIADQNEIAVFLVDIYRSLCPLFEP